MERLSYSQTYTELCNEIEVLEIRMNDLQLERKYLCKSMFASMPKFNGVVDYSKDVVMGGGNDTPLNKIVEQIDNIDEKLSTMSRILQAKKSTLRKFEAVLDGFDGIEYKIAYMRDEKGMKLYEIADRLGYSYSWVRQVARKTNKRTNKKF